MMKGETVERWRTVCQRAQLEKDAAKLMEIIQEINRLLEEKEQRFRARKQISIRARIFPVARPRRISGKPFAPVQPSNANNSEPERDLLMSHVDMKPLGFWPKHAEVSASQEDSYQTVELADELIRALDAESNEHMQQISAEDKLRNS
jgi:hypothetical protein